MDDVPLPEPKFPSFQFDGLHEDAYTDDQMRAFGAACAAAERARTIDALRAALAQGEAQPVAWRDHVEQRIWSWRQRAMSRSGDHLAIGDFMDSNDIDDLVDYVCDEYAEPSAPPPPAEPADDYETAAYENMCPNCVTPWKCNGPHEPAEPTNSTAHTAPTNATWESIAQSDHDDLRRGLRFPHGSLGEEA